MTPAAASYKKPPESWGLFLQLGQGRTLVRVEAFYPTYSTINLNFWQGNGSGAGNQGPGSWGAAFTLDFLLTEYAMQRSCRPIGRRLLLASWRKKKV